MNRTISAKRPDPKTAGGDYDTSHVFSSRSVMVLFRLSQQLLRRLPCPVIVVGQR